MNYLQRNKPVKAVTPANTIAKVQQIIKKLGCRAQEHDCSLYGGLFYSYNLALYKQNENKVLFACNGKGMTSELALASAYGELMERLQNLPFYMATVYYSEIENADCPAHDMSDVQYTPDEKIFKTDELVRSDMPLLRKLFSANNISQSDMTDYLNNKLKWNQMRCVPFVDISTGKKYYLPFRFMQWIVGSNGMCAGNTRQEALIQGISEVFERAVLKAIYIQPFTPPDVPVELFCGHSIFDRIKQLQEHEHLRIVIKDCSLGRELPVLGILVFSDDDQAFTFHLGANPNPVTALERCFTELFQGSRPCFHPVTSSNKTNCDVRSSSYWRQQLHRSIQSYGGQWPSCLLAKTPDYKFNGFSYRVSNSDEQDLDRLLQLINKMDYQVLVRDAGFLKFPAYYVYVPGMSEITNAIDNKFIEQLAVFERQLPSFFKMRNVSSAKHKELARLIAVYNKAALSGEFDAGIYFRHCPGAPVAAMRSREIISALQNSQIPDSQPLCFDCCDCKETAGCAFESMNGLWQTLKNIQLQSFKEGSDATAF